MSARRTRARRVTAGRAARIDERPALGAAVTPFHRVEPVEIDPPENAALDRLESDVRALIAAGAGVAVVSRLRRILPELKAGGSDA